MRIRPHTLTAYAALICALLIPLPALSQDGLADLAELEEEEEKQNYWESIYDPNRPAFEKLIDEAYNAMLGGDFEALEGRFAEMRKARPEANGTRFFEAVIAEHKGDYKKSIALLEAIVASGDYRDITAEAVYFDLAYSFTRLSRLEEGIEAYKRSLANRSGGDTPHVILSNLAELYMASGDLDQAIRTWRESLSHNDSYTHAIFGLAVAFERKGHHDISRAYTLKGLTIDPKLETYLGPKTFFIPAEDKDFVRGLIAEEQGRWKEAREHFALYNKLAAQQKLPYLKVGQRAISRVEGLGDLRLGHGPIPLHKPTAVAADPKGRGIAMGDALGRVVITRLNKQEVISSPTLSGKGVWSMAYAPGGKRLLVARDDLYIDDIDVGRGGKMGKPQGPAKLPNGGRVQGLSSDGRAFISTNTHKARYWGAGRIAELSKERGKITIHATAKSIALGPWDDESGSMVLAFWTDRRNLEIKHIPDAKVNLTYAPPQGSGDHAIAMSPDGRHVILVSDKHAIVCRVADLQVVKMLSLESEAAWGAPIRAVIDKKGGAGHGPALVVFYAGHYAAYSLKALGL